MRFVGIPVEINRVVGKISFNSSESLDVKVIHGQQPLVGQDLLDQQRKQDGDKGQVLMVRPYEPPLVGTMRGLAAYGTEVIRPCIEQTRFMLVCVVCDAQKNGHPKRVAERITAVQKAGWSDVPVTSGCLAEVPIWPHCTFMATRGEVVQPEAVAVVVEGLEIFAASNASIRSVPVGFPSRDR